MKNSNVNRTLAAIGLTIFVSSYAFAAKKSAPPQTQAAPTPATAESGPKVHTSKSKDVSGCSDTSNQAAAAAGKTVGGIAAIKLGGGFLGSAAGQAAGSAAATEASNAGRCSAKAEVGEDAAPEPQPKPKKKIRIPGLGF